MDTQAIAVGQPAIWFRTLGGGGGSGHRKNEREPVVVTVLAIKNRVQVRVKGRLFDVTWVSRDSVETLQAVVDRLLFACSEANFACGEWDRNDSDEEFDAVCAAATKADADLRTFILRLASQPI